MKVTIITATFNSQEFIEDCMISVLNQEYDNIEYVIIDGASKDNTLEIIKSFQTHHAHIRLISEPDKGIYDALNKGLIHASGDVVGFVHSDDVLANTTIVSNVVDCIKNRDVDGVYGDLLYVRKEDTNKVIRHWKGKQFSPALLKRGWMPAHPTLFIKQEVYLSKGNFDLTFKIAADYDFILRIFKDRKLNFEYLPNVFTKMRVGGVSNRNMKSILLKTKEDLRALRNNSMPFPFWIVVSKNVSKLSQFFIK